MVKQEIIVQIGGIGRGRPADALNIRYTYRLPYEVTGTGSLGLNITGCAELNNAISGLYELTVNQPANTRTNYAIYWGSQLLSQLEDILAPDDYRNFDIGINPDGTLRSITPNFRYKFAEDAFGQIFIKFLEPAFLPKYLEAESGGFVQFTPEFNIPTTFDNANFVRAEDDNYTNRIDQFIISPQFNLALHVRPKTYKYESCPNKDCYKCEKRIKREDKCRKYTTTSALQAFVTFCYQTCLKVQKEEISASEGEGMILEKIDMFKKYRGAGASTYNFEIDPRGFVNLVFCTRYRLKNTDCIVGFTMQGIPDIFTERTEPEFRQIIMNASSVPIDEDMTDAIWPSNTGLFVYENNQS